MFVDRRGCLELGIAFGSQYLELGFEPSNTPCFDLKVSKPAFDRAGLIKTPAELSDFGFEFGDPGRRCRGDRGLGIGVGQGEFFNTGFEVQYTVGLLLGCCKALQQIFHVGRSGRRWRAAASFKQRRNLDAGHVIIVEVVGVIDCRCFDLFIDRAWQHDLWHLRRLKTHCFGCVGPPGVVQMCDRVDIGASISITVGGIWCCRLGFDLHLEGSHRCFEFANLSGAGIKVGSELHLLFVERRAISFGLLQLTLGDIPLMWAHRAAAAGEQPHQQQTEHKSRYEPTNDLECGVEHFSSLQRRAQPAGWRHVPVQLRCRRSAPERRSRETSTTNR